MKYDLIDPQITRWADRHSLIMSKPTLTEEFRNFYISSASGECFQIWVDAPKDEMVCIHAACIQGRKEDDIPQDWCVSVFNLEVALDAAFSTVMRWMAPSSRFFQ